MADNQSEVGFDLQSDIHRLQLISQQDHSSQNLSSKLALSREDIIYLKTFTNTLCRTKQIQLSNKTTSFEVQHALVLSLSALENLESARNVKVDLDLAILKMIAFANANNFLQLGITLTKHFLIKLSGCEQRLEWNVDSSRGDLGITQERIIFKDQMNLIPFCQNQLNKQDILEIANRNKQRRDTLLMAMVFRLHILEKIVVGQDSEELAHPTESEIEGKQFQKNISNYHNTNENHKNKQLMEELTIVEGVVEDKDKMFSEVIQVRHRMMLRKLQGVELGQLNGKITQDLIIFLKNLMINNGIEMNILTSILQDYLIPVQSNCQQSEISSIQDSQQKKLRLHKHQIISKAYSAAALGLTIEKALLIVQIITLHFDQPTLILNAAKSIESKLQNYSKTNVKLFQDCNQDINNGNTQNMFQKNDKLIQQKQSKLNFSINVPEEQFQTEQEDEEVIERVHRTRSLICVLAAVREQKIRVFNSINKKESYLGDNNEQNSKIHKYGDDDYTISQQTLINQQHKHNSCPTEVDNETRNFNSQEYNNILKMSQLQETTSATAITTSLWEVYEQLEDVYQGFIGDSGEIAISECIFQEIQEIKRTYIDPKLNLIKESTNQDNLNHNNSFQQVSSLWNEKDQELLVLLLIQNIILQSVQHLSSIERNKVKTQNLLSLLLFYSSMVNNQEQFEFYYSFRRPSRPWGCRGYSGYSIQFLALANDFIRDILPKNKKSKLSKNINSKHYKLTLNQIPSVRQRRSTDSRQNSQVSSQQSQPSLNNNDQYINLSQSLIKEKILKESQELNPQIIEWISDYVKLIAQEELQSHSIAQDLLDVLLSVLCLTEMDVRVITDVVFMQFYKTKTIQTSQLVSFLKQEQQQFLALFRFQAIQTITAKAIELLEEYTETQSYSISLQSIQKLAATTSMILSSIKKSFTLLLTNQNQTKIRWPLRVSSDSFQMNLTDLSSRCKIIKSFLLKYPQLDDENLNKNDHSVNTTSGFLQQTCNIACKLLSVIKDKSPRISNINSLSSHRRMEVKGLLEDVADTFGEAVSLSKGDVGMQMKHLLTYVEFADFCITEIGQQEQTEGYENNTENKFNNSSTDKINQDQNKTSNNNGTQICCSQEITAEVRSVILQSFQQFYTLKTPINLSDDNAYNDLLLQILLKVGQILKARPPSLSKSTSNTTKESSSINSSMLREFMCKSNSSQQYFSVRITVVNKIITLITQSQMLEGIAAQDKYCEGVQKYNIIINQLNEIYEDTNIFIRNVFSELKVQDQGNLDVLQLHSSLEAIFKIIEISDENKFKGEYQYTQQQEQLEELDKVLKSVTLSLQLSTFFETPLLSANLQLIKLIYLISSEQQSNRSSCYAFLQNNEIEKMIAIQEYCCCLRQIGLEQQAGQVYKRLNRDNKVKLNEEERKCDYEHSQNRNNRSSQNGSNDIIINLEREYQLDSNEKEHDQTQNIQENMKQMLQTCQLKLLKIQNRIGNIPKQLKIQQQQQQYYSNLGSKCDEIIQQINQIDKTINQYYNHASINERNNLNTRSCGIGCLKIISAKAYLLKIQILIQSNIHSEYNPNQFNELLSLQARHLLKKLLQELVKLLFSSSTSPSNKPLNLSLCGNCCYICRLVILQILNQIFDSFLSSSQVVLAEEYNNLISILSIRLLAFNYFIGTFQRNNSKNYNYLFGSCQSLSNPNSIICSVLDNLLIKKNISFTTKSSQKDSQDNSNENQFLLSFMRTIFPYRYHDKNILKQDTSLDDFIMQSISSESLKCKQFFKFTGIYYQVILYIAVDYYQYKVDNNQNTLEDKLNLLELKYYLEEARQNLRGLTEILKVKRNKVDSNNNNNNKDCQENLDSSKLNALDILKKMNSYFIESTQIIQEKDNKSNNKHTNKDTIQHQNEINKQFADVAVGCLMITKESRSLYRKMYWIDRQISSMCFQIYLRCQTVLNNILTQWHCDSPINMDRLLQEVNHPSKQLCNNQFHDPKDIFIDLAIHLDFSYDTSKSEQIYETMTNNNPNFSIISSDPTKQLQNKPQQTIKAISSSSSFILPTSKISSLSNDQSLNSHHTFDQLDDSNSIDQKMHQIVTFNSQTLNHDLIILNYVDNDGFRNLRISKYNYLTKKYSSFELHSQFLTDSFAESISEILRIVKLNELDLKNDETKRKSQIDASVWWKTRLNNDALLGKYTNQIASSLDYLIFMFFGSECTDREISLYNDVHEAVSSTLRYYFDITCGNQLDKNLQEVPNPTRDSMATGSDKATFDSKNLYNIHLSMSLSSRDSLEEGLFSVLKALCFLKHTSSKLNIIFQLLCLHNPLLHAVGPAAQQTLFIQIKEIHEKFIKNYNPCSKKPVLLLLSPSLERIPFEFMRCFTQNGQVFYRQPSISYLMENYKHNNCVDFKSNYYLLNPSGDLIDTQLAFQSQFQSTSCWNGITGTGPNVDTLQQILTDKEVYTYMGHGAGEMYLPISGIQQIPRIKSVALLFGCSSARQIVETSIDGISHSEQIGCSVQLLMNSCPMISGSLWDVTDRDTDKMVQCLISLLQKNKLPIDYATAVLHARQECKMKYLNGAAFVCYGIPTCFSFQ